MIKILVYNVYIRSLLCICIYVYIITTCTTLDTICPLVFSQYASEIKQNCKTCIWHWIVSILQTLDRTHSYFSTHWTVYFRVLYIKSEASRPETYYAKVIRTCGGNAKRKTSDTGSHEAKEEELDNSKNSENLCNNVLKEREFRAQDWDNRRLWKLKANSP